MIRTESLYHDGKKDVQFAPASLEAERTQSLGAISRHLRHDHRLLARVVLRPAKETTRTVEREPRSRHDTRNRSWS